MRSGRHCSSRRVFVQGGLFHHSPLALPPPSQQTISVMNQSSGTEEFHPRVAGRLDSDEPLAVAGIRTDVTEIGHQSTLRPPPRGRTLLRPSFLSRKLPTFQFPDF